MSEHRPNCKCAECENPSGETLDERLDRLECGLRDMRYAHDAHVLNQQMQPKAQVRIVADPDLMPVRATEGAAGFDLKSALNVDLDPGQRSRIPTGVRIALPPGYEAQVRPRSGLSLRGLDVAIGTVDADYRGEISIVVVNNTGENFAISRGERLAQMVVHRLPEVRLVQVEGLDETARGSGGFGSTGA